MKKLIAIVAVAVTGFASFGQGFFTFTGATRGVWDCFSTTPVSPKLAADMNVGFLWGTGSAAISAIANSIATNNTAGISSTAQAWTAITTDPNYTIAFNSGTGTQAVAANVGNGSWSYNGAGTFGVTGTSASTYNIIVFAWSSAYATAALAAAAGSPVGWSAPFSYTATASIGTPLSMTSSGLLPFGVTTVVPEPTTIALAGLGGLALLALRRKK